MNDVDRILLDRKKERAEVRALVVRLLDRAGETYSREVAKRWRWSGGRRLANRISIAQSVLAEMEAAGELTSRIVEGRGIQRRMYRRTG